MILIELDGLDDEALNRELPFAPANTIYQLGVHVAGSARWWVITNTGGTDFHRNRPAEFTATGTGDHVRSDLELLIRQVEEHLAALDADELDLPGSIEGAGMSNWTGPLPLSRRDGVLHAVEHTAVHLGHIQLTRQIFGFPPPSGQEV